MVYLKQQDQELSIQKADLSLNNWIHSFLSNWAMTTYEMQAAVNLRYHEVSKKWIELIYIRPTIL